MQLFCETYFGFCLNHSAQWIYQLLDYDMAPVKFPRRRSDGSFCVEVALHTDAQDPVVLASRVTSWLVEWVQANRYGTTSFADRMSGVLDFFDEFARVPSCIEGTPRFLLLRMECSREAKKRWKNWLILRLLPDLQEAFREITSVQQITNCSGEEASNAT